MSPGAPRSGRLIGVLLAFVLSVLSAATAQSAPPAPGAVSFRRVAIPDDVPAHLCTALAQDRDGFLWIGTQAGLVRYDGYSFRVYRSDPEDPQSLGAVTCGRCSPRRMGGSGWGRSA